jgi:hypothetical protein
MVCMPSACPEAFAVNANHPSTTDVGAAPRRLYTIGDLAGKLGVTRQRALRIANERRVDLPEPFDTLPGGIQVWLIEDVATWISGHRRVIAEETEVSWASVSAPSS